MFSKILDEENPPEEWMDGVICPIYEKIDKLEQIFCHRQILENCREHNVPTHHIFIDFKAAYDTVDREQQWQITQDNGFPDKLTRLVKATMERVSPLYHAGGWLILSAVQRWPGGCCAKSGY